MASPCLVGARSSDVAIGTVRSLCAFVASPVRAAAALVDSASRRSYGASMEDVTVREILRMASPELVTGAAHAAVDAHAAGDDVRVISLESGFAFPALQILRCLEVPTP